MRKYMKMQLLEMADTIKELCSVIISEYNNKNTDYVMKLLEQGQQAAIAMGETIENLVGEGTEAVSVLESFCEYIYQLGQRLINEEELNKKDEKNLDKLMLRLGNGIRHLPVKYEVVFMPYKASMWDCMESIYKAADADPDCDVYVVPIPYYDFDEHRNPIHLNYEGELFPEDIKITSYADYKLDEHKPDVIYIHNPFDGLNKVTSVHPDFYSDKLKNYTEKLVYVPYYATGGNPPEGQRKLPVHFTMDYMVIQSKKEEQFYTDKIFGGKLLPLGSPKFDKVINYKKNNVSMPKEWGTLLEGKKKVFYNTSITSLLEDTDKALTKMEYVFNCFKGRDDIALIWRPHPLTVSTLQSMRPKYMQWYNELVNYFKQNKIGILDLTSDISRTVAVSDAYIGEPSSSVLWLFIAAGKPIFILDGNIDNEKLEDACDVRFCNVESYQGQNWTFSAKYNALCTFDMETGRLHIVDSIPGYKKKQGWLVTQVYGYKNKLILTPNCMDSIVEYDLEKKTFSFFPLPNALPNGNMGGIIPFGEDFFIMPAKYPAIIQYSAKKNKYIYHTQMIKDVMQYGSDIEYADNRNCLGGGYIKDELFYITLTKTNGILIWNMSTNKYEIVHVGNENNTYGAITEVNNGFLIHMYEGAKLLFWNPDTGETREISEFPKSFEYRLNPREESHPFGGFWNTKNHLVLVSQLGNQFLEIDRETLEISEYAIDWKDHIKEPQEGLYDNRWGHFRSFLVPDRKKGLSRTFDEVGIITSSDGCLLNLNLDTHEYTEVQTGIDLDEIKSFFDIGRLFEKFALPISSIESIYHSLNDFIEAIIDGRIPVYSEEQIQTFKERAANLDGTCGEKVHYTVKKSLE